MFQEKLESVTAQLQELQKSDEESREALRVAHQTSLTAEREQLKTHTHQVQKHAYRVYANNLVQKHVYRVYANNLVPCLR